MKLLLIFLFACTLTPVYAQEKHELPSDGNGLLEYCSVVITLADSRDSITSLSDDRFAEQMQKVYWCSGYLQAVGDDASLTQVNLAVIGAMGITLSGPDKQREAAFNILRGACIPEKVPVIQLARVLVKWLQEHPARLCRATR
ncbi:MAG TPA: Rap1a/Tai family immunity protein [Terriglobales bacterium]|nr:Rap1a/Tai family immunity protein [Terriglobales bacterium]